ncbi:MAG: RNA recognition motif domain-containing protein [Bacteroidia bacterium]
MNIFVASLPFSADDQDLREIFEPFGEVTSSKVIFDRDRNRSKGFGFVEMADDAAAQNAISELNESSYEGRTIVVKVAEERPQRNDRRY